LITVCVGVLTYNALVLINWLIDKNRLEQEIVELADDLKTIEIDGGEPVNPPDDTDSDYWDFVKLPLIDVDIAALKNRNADTVGFLSVAGTNINYPVVQTSDNDYYLTHSFKKDSNRAGWIFMDYRSQASLSDRNTIIYGHGRIDGAMFGSLKNILDTAWVDNRDNQVIRYVTESETMLFQVFAVYTVPSESQYIQTVFSSDTEYQNWLDTMINRSQYNFHTTLNENDQILTLSTCYGASSQDRVVMQAKLIKKTTVRLGH